MCCDWSGFVVDIPNAWLQCVDWTGCVADTLNAWLQCVVIGQAVWRTSQTPGYDGLCCDWTGCMADAPQLVEPLRHRVQGVERVGAGPDGDS